MFYYLLYLCNLSKWHAYPPPQLNAPILRDGIEKMRSVNSKRKTFLSLFLYSHSLFFGSDGIAFSWRLNLHLPDQKSSKGISKWKMEHGSTVEVSFYCIVTYTPWKKMQSRKRWNNKLRCNMLWWTALKTAKLLWIKDIIVNR